MNHSLANMVDFLVQGQRDAVTMCVNHSLANMVGLQVGNGCCFVNIRLPLNNSL